MRWQHAQNIKAQTKRELDGLATVLCCWSRTTCLPLSSEGIHLGLLWCLAALLPLLHMPAFWRTY